MKLKGRNCDQLHVANFLLECLKHTKPSQWHVSREPHLGEGILRVSILLWSQVNNRGNDRQVFFFQIKRQIQDLLNASFAKTGECLTHNKQINYQTFEKNSSKVWSTNFFYWFLHGGSLRKIRTVLFLYFYFIIKPIIFMKVLVNTKEIMCRMH